jgi:tight adherence protein C
MFSLSGPFSLSPTLIVLLGAVAMLASGSALIVSAIGMSRGIMARRIDLVMPRRTAVAAENAPGLEKVFVGRGSPGAPEGEQREIARHLARLGVPAHFASSVFLAGRLLTAVGLGLMTFLLVRRFGVFARWGAASPVVALGAAIVGYLLPSMLIQLSAKRRAGTVVAAMPEALDLLVVCVDAGFSLEDALSRVVSELKRARPALAEELAITSADMQILPSRDEALERLANRIDAPAVRSVVTTLAQTLRYGTPLSTALRVIAAEMRDDALTQLEERANQLPALLTIPMMLFIMPTIFLVVGGPAALQLIDTLGR